MLTISPAYLCAMGGFLIHLVLGTLYCWGNITTFVTSHVRKYDSSITYDDTIEVYTTTLAFQGLFMLIGGLIEKSIGARRTIFLGGYLIVIGTFLASVATSLAQLIIFGGVMFGTGTGMIYSTPISCAIRWKPEKKALLSGIVVSGFGGGAFVFGLIANRLVNPNGMNMDTTSHSQKYFDAHGDVANRVPMMYQVFGSCFFVLITIGGLLVQDKQPIEDPSDERRSHDSAKEAGNLTVSSTIITSSSYSKLEDGDFELKSKVDESPVVGVAEYPREPTVFPRSQGISPAECEYVKIEQNSNINSSVANPIHNLMNLNGSDDLTTDIPNNCTDTDTDHTLHHHPLSLSLQTTALSGPIQYKPAQMVRCVLAWQLGSCFMFTAAPGMFIAGTFKTFGELAFQDEAFLSDLGASSSLFNAFGRLAVGAVADRLGLLRTIQIATLTYSILVFTYPQSVGFGKIGFSFWTYVIFIFEGINFTLYPAINSQLFGLAFASANYGFIFIMFIFGCVVNITILSVLDVNFQVSSCAMAIVLFAGFINLILLEVRAHRTGFLVCVTSRTA